MNFKDFKEWLLLESDQAFLNNAKNNPHDDTNWLVYADYLDEKGQSEQASRIRWWIGAREAMREERNWDTTNPYLVDRDNIYPPRHSFNFHERLNKLPDWVCRLFIIEHGRVTADKFYRPDNKNFVTLGNNANHVAEKHAFGLATDEELEKARKSVFLRKDNLYGFTASVSHPDFQFLRHAWYNSKPYPHLLDSIQSARNFSYETDHKVKRKKQDILLSHPNQLENGANSAMDALLKYAKENPPPK